LRDTLDALGDGCTGFKKTLVFLEEASGSWNFFS